MRPPFLRRPRPATPQQLTVEPLEQRWLLHGGASFLRPLGGPLFHPERVAVAHPRPAPAPGDRGHFPSYSLPRVPLVLVIDLGRGRGGPLSPAPDAPTSLPPVRAEKPAAPLAETVVLPQEARTAAGSNARPPARPLALPLDAEHSPFRGPGPVAPGPAAPGPTHPIATAAPRLATDTVTLLASVRSARPADAEPLPPPDDSAVRASLRVPAPATDISRPRVDSAATSMSPLPIDFFPQVADLLTEGVRLGQAALGRAAEATSEAAGDAAFSSPGLLYGLGLASWLMAAALACEAARRPRRPFAVLRTEAGVGPMTFLEETAL